LCVIAFLVCVPPSLLGGTISGYIGRNTPPTAIPMVGVTVRAGTASAVTGSDGRYTIEDAPVGFGIEVRPSAPGYIFDPEVRFVDLPLRTSVASAGFSGLPAPNVSGRVRDGAAGVPSVVVSVGNLSTVTDGSGAYVLSNVVWGTRIISATKSGQRFLPVSRELFVGDDDVTNVNFDLAHTVNGYVRDGAEPIVGAIVVATNASLEDRTVTLSDGAFSISNIIAGTYTVRPLVEGFITIPLMTNVTVGPSRSNVNFSIAHFDVGGRVTEGGVGISNVTLQAGSLSTTTDVDGYYVFTNVGGAVLIRPSQEGEVFSPSAIAIMTRLGATNIDFVRGTSSGVTRVVDCELGALRAALDAGGHIELDCEGTIPVLNTLVVRTNASVDAGQRRITLDGELRTRVLMVQTNVNFAMSNLTIMRGVADRGGAVFNDGGRLIIAGSTLITNSARGTAAQPRAEGGAVYAQFGAVRIYDSSLQRNSSYSPESPFSSGGAFFLLDAESSFERCKFVENSASGAAEPNRHARGGGVAVLGGQAWFSEAEFATNRVVGGHPYGLTGGGDAEGGAIYGNGARLVLTRSALYRNQAIGGTSIYADTLGTGGYLHGDGSGGAICVRQSSLFVTNSTIYDNLVNGGNAANEGGPGMPGVARGAGICLNVATGTVVHCTIAANTAVPTGLDESINSAAPTTVANSIVHRGFAGVMDSGGNLFVTNYNLPPVFGPFGLHGGYTPTVPLLSSNPAIDRAQLAGSLREDQRGSPRPVGLAPDSGAYEFYVPPTFTSASPMVGRTGSAVTIAGDNLLLVTQIRFNGVNAEFTAGQTSATSIVLNAIVPPGAATGPITLVPAGSSNLVSAFDFVVDNTPPVLSILTPRDQTFVSGLDSISGLLNDSHSEGTSGIADLSLYLQAIDGRYWNGTTWTSTRTSLSPLLTVNTWAVTNSLPTLGTLLDGPYTIIGEARDHAANLTSVTNSVTVDQSGSVSQLERLADGRVRVRFPGAYGRVYRLEASVDLFAWAILGTVTVGPSGILEFVDSNAAVYQQRFYRAVLP